MTAELKILSDAGRIPHALVIEGGTYDLRLSCTKELAAVLVNDEKKVLSDNHPDVITVNLEDRKKTVSVEQIRRMRDDAYIVPNENERKVYIIARAELMLDYAQNALLKILEEPPLYANFILLCDTHSSLLPTVLSRVAVFNISDADKDSDTDDSGLCSESAKSLAACIAKKDRFLLMKETAGLEKNYDSLLDILDALTLIIRDALFLKSGSAFEALSKADEEAALLARTFSENELLSKRDGIEEIKQSLKIYANKTLTLTRLEYKLYGGNNA